jgi:hypothetical protein
MQPGHISVELSGGDGLVIGGDALTNATISFQYPSWRVPVDHEADRGISTRLGLVPICRFRAPASSSEAKDGAYRFVAA